MKTIYIEIEDIEVVIFLLQIPNAIIDSHGQIKNLTYEAEYFKILQKICLLVCVYFMIGLCLHYVYERELTTSRAAGSTEVTTTCTADSQATLFWRSRADVPSILTSMMSSRRTPKAQR